VQRSRYKRAACQELYLYLAARSKSRANGVDGGPGGRGGRWVKGKGQLARAGINKHQQAPASNQQATNKQPANNQQALWGAMWDGARAGGQEKAGKLGAIREQVAACASKVALGRLYRHFHAQPGLHPRTRFLGDLGDSSAATECAGSKPRSLRQPAVVLGRVI